MIGAVTGGRDHWASLAELEAAAAEFAARGVEVVRDGDAAGVDRTWAGWSKSRGLFTRDKYPADWTRFGTAAGPIRNRDMLAGEPPDLFGSTGRDRVGILAAFTGNDGTADCCDAAAGMGIEVVQIRAKPEPRIWNRHHGDPPGEAVYVGRNASNPSKSHPLANPEPLEVQRGETRAQAVTRNLQGYRRWLWSRINPRSPDVDPRVGAALGALTPAMYLVCSCWPAQCHAEIIVRAWRSNRVRP